MIMEADRSQDLQSASWRSRRADGVILNVGRLETQEELIVWFKSEGRACHYTSHSFLGFEISQLS